METHFKLIDYTKNLLFNATNKEQEKQAKHILELAQQQEKYLMI